MKVVIRLDVTVVSSDGLWDALVEAKDLAVERFDEMVFAGDHFDHVSVSGKGDSGSYTIDFN